MISVCVLGDVVAKAGRQALDLYLPELKAKYDPDIVVINGENLAGGFGLSKKIYQQLIEKHQLDLITMGDHWADNREIYHFGFEPDAKLAFPGNAWNLDAPKH